MVSTLASPLWRAVTTPTSLSRPLANHFLSFHDSSVRAAQDSVNHRELKNTILSSLTAWLARKETLSFFSSFNAHWIASRTSLNATTSPSQRVAEQRLTDVADTIALLPKALDCSKQALAETEASLDVTIACANPAETVL